MRLSDLEGRDIINIADGTKFGVINYVDLLLDEQTGEINTLILPKKTGLLDFILRRNTEINVPLSAIKKVGDEVVVIDLAKQKPKVT